MRNQILQGDVLEVAKGLPDQSVNCIVTSPPYWGLRDYQTGRWDGGDDGCDHATQNQVQDTKAPGAITGGVRTGSGNSTCRKCGATRIDRQLGLEETPEAYVTRMVEIFRELKRVLRDDGNCWLNLGDSYATGTKAGRPDYSPTGKVGANRPEAQNSVGRCGTPEGMKTKDLVGIPWMVAFALRADGWYLRSDIIWEKKNCMPESVTDRPTKAHEYIFLLSKSAQYFYDQDVIRDPHKEDSLKRYKYGLQATAPKDGLISAGSDTGAFKCERMGDHMNPQGRNKRTVWSAPDAADPLLSYLLDKLAADNPEQLQAYLDQYACNATIKSDIWEVATKPFKGAHFAAFPPKLIKPCILAGCPEQVCAKCGEPWVRVVKKTGESLPVEERTGRTGHNGQPPQISENYWEGPTTKSTNVFVPTCACNTPDTRPGIVLDPFMGSGTTAQVAIQNRRDWLGIELNPKYIELAKGRIDGLQVRLL